MIKIEFSKNFKDEFKLLYKKYPSIKHDVDWLMDILEENWAIWVPLWNNAFKVRLKNSDNNKWKSAWYRVITFIVEEWKLILLSIYSKHDTDTV